MWKAIVIVEASLIFKNSIMIVLRSDSNFKSCKRQSLSSCDTYIALQLSFRVKGWLSSCQKEHVSVVKWDLHISLSFLQKMQTLGTKHD